MYKMKQKGMARGSLEMKIFPYILILPNFFIFVAFIAVPAAFGLYYSLTSWKGIGEPVFIGLANYSRLLSDTKFWQSIYRTFIYVLISLPIVMSFPMLIATLMIRNLRGRGFYRAAFYWPSMISYIVVGISFKFIFGDNTGVINYLLNLLHVKSVDWLTTDITAMLVVVLATVWSRTGFYMVTYISGLQSIPESYYEAADVDGATKLKSFLHITLPLLRPTTFLVMILGLIDLFKAYGLVISLTNGGPTSSTKFIVQFIYEKAFNETTLGYASALSMVMLLMMAVFTLLQFSLNRGGRIDA